MLYHYIVSGNVKLTCYLPGTLQKPYLVERIFHRQLKVEGFANSLITPGPIPGESQARPLQARKKGIFFLTKK